MAVRKARKARNTSATSNTSTALVVANEAALVAQTIEEAGDDAAEHDAASGENVQNYALAFAAALDVRISAERQHYDTMNEKQRDVCDKKIKAIVGYMRHIANEPSMSLLMATGLSPNFINTAGLGGKYNIKKVCELAAYLAGVNYGLNEYDEIAFRTLANCHNDGVVCSREHIQDGITHTPRFAQTWQMPGFCKDHSTATSQDLSSVAAFKALGMVTTAKRGRHDVYALRADSIGAQALASKLGITLN